MSNDNKRRVIKADNPNTPIAIPQQSYYISGSKLFHISDDGTHTDCSVETVAKLRAALQEIRDIAVYRNDGTEIVNICNELLGDNDDTTT